MSIEREALDELHIPPETTVEEHAIVTDASVLIGGQSDIEFEIRGDSILGGEGIEVGGDIEAAADCRLGMWSTVDGSVLVGRDAYLGERVSIRGKLVVGRDLDIGDDVSIDEGFEANGWIVIRNPMPLVLFLIAYLSHVIRTGDEEAIEALKEAANAAADELPSLDDDDAVMVVPRGATITDDSWQVSTPARIGAGVRLHGNIRAERIRVESDATIYGSLRSRSDVMVATGTVIHGDVEAGHGSVDLAAGSTIKGDVRGHDLTLTPDTIVEGTMRASGGVDILDGSDET